MGNSTVQVAIVGMTEAGKTVLISTLAMKMSQMADQGIFLTPVGDNRRQTLQYVQQNWQLFNSGQCPPSTPTEEPIQLQWELTTKTNNSANVRFVDCTCPEIRAIFDTEQLDINSLTSKQKDAYNYLHNANILIFLINMEDVLGRSFKESLENSLNINHMLDILNQPPITAVENTRIAIVDRNMVQVPAENFSSFNLQKLISWIVQSVDELAPKLAKEKGISENLTSFSAIKTVEQNVLQTQNTKSVSGSTSTDMRVLNWVLSSILFGLLAISLFSYFMDKQTGSQDSEAMRACLLAITIFGMLFLHNIFYGIRLGQITANLKKWEDEKNFHGNEPVRPPKKILYDFTIPFTILMSGLLFTGLFIILRIMFGASWFFCIVPATVVTFLYFSAGIGDMLAVRKIARSNNPVQIEQRMKYLKSVNNPIDVMGCCSYLLFLLVIIVDILLQIFGFNPLKALFSLNVICGIILFWWLISFWKMIKKNW